MSGASICLTNGYASIRFCHGLLPSPKFNGQCRKRKTIWIFIRLPQIIDIYDLYGYNYARHILDVSITDKVDIKNRDLEVSLSTLGNDSIFTL